MQAQSDHILRKVETPPEHLKTAIKGIESLELLLLLLKPLLLQPSSYRSPHSVRWRETISSNKSDDIIHSIGLSLHTCADVILYTEPSRTQCLHHRPISMVRLFFSSTLSIARQDQSFQLLPRPIF